MTRSVNSEHDLRALVATYMAAWNRGDGAGYASAFADDADFTSVRLDRPHSRAEIAAGHDAIFATIYKGTRLRAEVDRIRFVRPDVVVLDVEHHLTDAAGMTFPPGPLPRHRRSRAHRRRLAVRSLSEHGPGPGTATALVGLPAYGVAWPRSD
jgi:uncharacterized protein (TIGR02246 family)